MKVIRFILLSYIFLTSFNTFSHNPEDFMIAEIERGQMYFQNEEDYINLFINLLDHKFTHFYYY